MKTPELQIANFLSAYNTYSVIEGFRIFCQGDIDGVLIKQGWKKLFPNKKPEDKEYFEVQGQIWIQDKTSHMDMVDAIQSSSIKKMDAVKTGLTIDCRNKKFKCQGKMRPHPTCGSCKEGKSGFKTKWVCTHCEMESFSRRSISEWKEQLLKS